LRSFTSKGSAIPKQEMRLKVAGQYPKVTNFPKCWGTFDGQHTRVIYPPILGTRYFN